MIDAELLKDAKRITKIDYKANEFNDVIGDLLWEIGQRDEKIKELETDIHENYIRKRQSDYEYGY